MNILFALGLEVNPKFGGVERVTYVLTQYFKSRGIKIHYYYFNLKEISYPEYNENVEVYFPPNIDIVDSKENIIFLNSIINTRGIDILINQGAIGDCISEVIVKSTDNSDVKIISVLHSTPFKFSLFYGQYRQTMDRYFQKEEKNFKNILKKRMIFFLAYNAYLNGYKKYLKISLDSSDRFVLLSKSYIPLIKKIMNVKIKSKLLSISNPISFKEDFPITEIKYKKKQIIYVGRLEYHAKRLDRLLNAWSLIENEAFDWKLIIVGGSVNNVIDTNDYQVKELERLKALIEKLQLKNIIFAGNTDPEIYYKESKLFCLTSSYEGFPLVLGEAMHYGVVPVVFGSFEAAFDIIENQVNGIIVKPFNIGNYASFLRELMFDESRTIKMAENAIRNAKKLSIEVIGDQWVSIFNELTGFKTIS